MEAPPKNYYHESVNGCIFPEKEEAINESIAAAAGILFDLIAHYEKDKRYNAPAETIIERRGDIAAAYRTLEHALDGKLVATYKIVAR